ncbi:hypothetical protein NXT08_23440 (plasmid) [Rhodococcus pyridinivorans]|uniref:hypothetical protein n=1 Tax=Rhodococcus TaxID=1827 RepID=UPI000A451541|nr:MULTISPECIES: hypothetical protein [Rhodococcus]MCT7293688.1 hypothetical protein [Rhodococcus sp. PAE-6]QXU56466.1 hypothetical protein KXC42_25130 [Rhodococcus sp. LW-XY12]UVT27524.1 hypothetical protein NXT08_23440 [Rhodococcus pyridinivorans]WML66311.1 hypothetical protein QNA09_28945 [Rhodococcus sp. AH-ZY2]WML66502.1 hypothetical protein QNA09_28250 [Rhodococcus sp. AH-ZY2]
MLTLIAHAVVAAIHLPLRYLGVSVPLPAPGIEQRVPVGHYGIHEDGFDPWDE